MQNRTEHIDVNDGYQDYLRDESRKSGFAEGIYFPGSAEDLSDILKSSHSPITVQGARTGITGGAVPEGGHIINLSRMDSVLRINREMSGKESSVIVQPGVSLSQIRESLINADTPYNQGVFFPPDPTETTASIGGMIACNASGARSYKYGPTRFYVSMLKVMTVAGDSIELRRGQDKAKGLDFCIKAGNALYSGSIPPYPLPSVKNASGYYSTPNMDLVDLFIGAEGTLGIIYEAELRLIPAPRFNWAVMASFPRMDQAVNFVHDCRSLNDKAVAAIEFFDDNALQLLRSQKTHNPAFSGIPEISTEWRNCVYVELDGSSDDELEISTLKLSELISENGGNADSAWMATEPNEMGIMKNFRHALPEAVNLTIDTFRRESPGITKLGTDFSVPDMYLGEVMDMYRNDLEKAELQHVIFGHIGNNHLHVNILPRTMAEFAQGKALYMKWARRVIAMKGTVSAEHGIGKIKTELLAEMFGAAGIESMQKLKRVFDPETRLNAGNLFPS